MRKKIIPVILLFIAAGCATAPVGKPTVASHKMPGTYHKVVKGETLWKISKLYAVDLDKLVSINRISDASTIESGQLIFVPEEKRTDFPVYAQGGAQDFIWPLKARVVTGFRERSGRLINKGINIECRKRQDILASSRGKVVFCADNFKGYGKTLIIDHGNGFLTVYAGIQELLVGAGVMVRQGDSIARVYPQGNKGQGYLHFEIRKGHIPQNPYFYLPS